MSVVQKFHTQVYSKSKSTAKCSVVYNGQPYFYRTSSQPMSEFHSCFHKHEKKLIIHVKGLKGHSNGLTKIDNC